MKQKLFSILALLLMAATGAWAQHDPTYIVAGNNAEIFGSVWYGTYEANKMTKGGDGKYTKTYNVEDAVDDIQLKVVKDGQDWIGDETGNNVTFSMKQAGSFTVTLDPNANPAYVTVTGDNVVLAKTEYAINYATGMQNGTVTGPDTAKEDDEVTLTITPAAGYVLESISVTGVTTENAVEVTDGKFTMPAEDVNVIATFKLVTYAITLAEGTEDADKWTISPASAAEGETVTITYTGNKRVQSVTAMKKAAIPVTSITLNKTETSISVGSTETLSVTAVAPDNATDKTYTWKTSDASKATVDQDGKVTAVAVGTVTIYAEANDGSGVKGSCTVTVTPVTVTWNSPNFNSSKSKDCVTLTTTSNAAVGNSFYDRGNNTFTTTLGKFTKIEIVCTYFNGIDGWTQETIGQYQPDPESLVENIYKLTWTGNAESVTIQGKSVYNIQSITFTIQ